MSNHQEDPFEEIFKQNERRIYYHMHKLGIHDPHREFYVEGIYAMWMAYKKYQPDKGPMSTYFNYIIRNRLIDLLRKESRTQEKDQSIEQAEITRIDAGNRITRTQQPVVEAKGIALEDEGLLEEIRSLLTEKQMKWVEGYLLNGLSIREIAEKEGVTEDTVKSWGKQARKKLRGDGGSLSN